MTRSIALIGLSGVGKSTLGQALAQHCGWPLFDTDALIVAEQGQSIAAFFAQHGEATFRQLEHRVLQQAFAIAPAVVATGGGIVLLPENRALLRERAFVVWLNAPTAELVARLQRHTEERPLLSGDDPAVRLERLRQERSGLYQSVADLVLQSHDNVDRLVRDVLQHYEPIAT